MLTSNAALYPDHLMLTEFRRVDGSIPFGFDAIDAPEFVSAGGMRVVESEFNPGRFYRIPVVAAR